MIFGSKTTIYLEIRRGSFRCRVLHTNAPTQPFEGPACVAVERRGGGIGRVRAVVAAPLPWSGDPSEEEVVLESFVHPRLLIADTDEAAFVVEQFLRQANGGKAPKIRAFILHVVEAVYGGLVRSERAELVRIGERLGAARVLLLYEGAVANDGEALEMAELH